MNPAPPVTRARMPPNPSRSLWAQSCALLVAADDDAPLILEVTQPREVRLYAKMFTQLQQSTVYRAEARALVTSAMADLASGWGDATR
jgi:hypothetical protein